MTAQLDGIRMQILWNKLTAIADEAAVALKRTSFSTVLRESNDFAVILLDQNGNSLCHGTLSVATFSGIAATTVKHLLSSKGRSWFADGDVIITNDPWIATGHKPDISMVAPVFYRGNLVGFVATSGHVTDIGGIGQSPDAHSLYEEGLGIPPLKFLTAAGYNTDLIDIIRDNVRVPDEVIGDCNAQISAARLASRRIGELLEEQDLPDLEEVGADLMDRAERSMRRAISEVPDGSYHCEVTTDGFDVPITVAVTVTVDGDELVLDFTGSSPQQARGINVVPNYAKALSSYGLKCLLDPFTPKNEGSFRPFREYILPEGSILNPRRPAAVFGRSLVGHVTTSAVFGALAPALPDRVIADSGSCPGIRPHFHGIRNGRAWAFVLFANGGMGARAGKDGLSVTGFPTNADCASMEVLENIVPLRCWRQELRQDSGGAGRFRGGLGQEVEVEYLADGDGMLGMMSERHEHPAFGLFGGQSGQCTIATLNDRDAPHKGRAPLATGDRLVVKYPGGGGYGDPRERDPERVRQDVEFGYVSAEAARELYGWTASQASKGE
jgi:N-methylhydantoinase B